MLKSHLSVFLFSRIQSQIQFKVEKASVNSCCVKSKHSTELDPKQNHKTGKTSTVNHNKIMHDEEKSVTAQLIPSNFDLI